MTKTQDSQKILDDQWLASTLVSLGYRLEDRGDHWRTSANFRGGNNSSAILIFKKTGVWHDFANPNGFLPFGSLLERTTDKSTAKKILSGIISYEGEAQVDSTLIKMEKVYSEASLSRLIPHFSFYTKRKISAELLKRLKSGYASGNKMYQRLVFPIYNKEGKIHGFSGRYIFWKDGDNKPKWKHIGQKKNWLYPLYTLPETALSIEKTEKAFLVESVGDALAMIEQGHPNVFVLFSLALSKSVITEMIARGVKEIIICTNKDSDGNGQIGAARIVCELIKHFDSTSISILTPIDNDIHDMHMRERNFNEWINTRINHTVALQEALKYSEHLKSKDVESIKKIIKWYE